MSTRNHLSLVGYNQEELYFEKLNRELVKEFQAKLKAEGKTQKKDASSTASEQTDEDDQKQAA
jgi:hypothetical protein